jgi:hypothetical protein
MAITAQQAQTQLDIWIAADTKVAKGQSYSIGSRSLTRADAAEITQKIEYWSAKLGQADGSSSRGTYYGDPS